MMRIGKFNQILKEATQDDGTLQTNAEALYGGNVYKIKDFKSKANLVSLLNDLQLLPDNADAATVDLIIQHLKSGSDEFLPETSEHNQIVALFNSINSTLPTIGRTVEAFTDTQDEQAINVKLPSSIKSLEELNKINTELNKLFKEFSIDGQVEFVGFDRGTSWETVVAVGAGTYYALLACIDIAQEAMKLRSEYYGSEKARVEYETAKEIFNQTKNAPSLEEFQDKKVEKEIESRVKEAVDKIKDKGVKSDKELANQLVKATTDLVGTLGKGVEFHLSLNPPEYISEESESFLKIDYSSMPTIEEPKDTKQITSGSKKESGADEKK